MVNVLRSICLLFMALIIFCYALNVLLIKQINDLHFDHSALPLETFPVLTTQIHQPAWFNPVLNGQKLIHSNSSYLVVDIIDGQYLGVNSQHIINNVLFSPATVMIILLMVILGSWLLSITKKSYKQKQALKNLCEESERILHGLKLATPDAQNSSTISRIQQAFTTLSNHFNSYAKESQTSICQDKLTLLIDRHAYLEHLSTQLSDAKKANLHCALLFIDLDGFKQVNDSFGHSFGDEVLIQVAARLTSVLRHHKLSCINPTSQLEQNLARLGGDEFSLFISEIIDDKKTLEVAQNVLQEIERDFVLGNKLIKISASIGIAVYPDSAATPHALLQMADVAMYRAKTDGRGIFKVYSPEMGNKMRRYHYLLEELRLAIACENFHLSFQPIVHVEDCAIDYFEALVRWDHPVEGAIAPTEFIPIAEESNLILELGDWIMLESCRQMSAWHNAGMRKVKISVNISGIQLKHRPVYDWVMSKLAKTGLPANALMLEITESTLIKASNSIIQQLEKLRKEGVIIAIDDFGTGFSSLSTLAELPIDVIKLDRLFITQANNNPKYNQILNSVSELGNRLGLKIVAEGVEELEQFELVKNMGISSVQGYLVSRPESSANVGNKVLHGNVNHIAATGTSVWGLESQA